MTDMIFSQFLPISCAAVISSFPQSQILSLFCRTLRQFWVWHWWWPPRRQKKRTKEEEEIHFTFFCIVVVLLCKVVVFCIFCWDPRFFSRAKTMKQMTWTPILLSATLVLLLGDNGKLFHFNYAHLPTWRMTHLERIFPLRSSKLANLLF